MRVHSCRGSCASIACHVNEIKHDYTEDVDYIATSQTFAVTEDGQGEHFVCLYIYIYMYDQDPLCESRQSLSSKLHFLEQQQQYTACHLCHCCCCFFSTRHLGHRFSSGNETLHRSKCDEVLQKCVDVFFFFFLSFLSFSTYYRQIERRFSEPPNHLYCIRHCRLRNAAEKRETYHKRDGENRRISQRRNIYSCPCLTSGRSPGSPPPSSPASDQADRTISSGCVAQL